MFAENVLHNITYPPGQTGIYKDEETSLISLVYELIEKKLHDSQHDTVHPQYC